MKMNFAYKTCEHCEHRIDGTAAVCPRCGRSTPFEGMQNFENDTHVGWIKNLLLFVIGWAGFQSLGMFVTIIAQTIFSGMHSGEDIVEAWNAFSNTPLCQMAINGSAYIALAVILILLVMPNLKEIGKAFTHLKPYIAGIIGFAVLIATSILWNLIASFINPGITENVNQSTIVSLTTAFPILSIIVFGFIGPFCEEITYRIGLFGFLKRKSRVLAYILTPIVFGLIHFAWSIFLNPGDAFVNELINELLNIPDYIIAGLVLSFLYDKYGFGASLTAHTLNNLTSFIQILILNSMGAL